jgi:uncharacterized membrane protein YhiD involved in acid resistance
MNGIHDLYTVLQFSLTPGIFIRNLLVALICGISISLFYVWTSKSPNSSRTFIGSLIFMTMIMAVVILVIGNNLARAFGLVGAMSIIRFRTAVKDVQDIVFIFFSLAIGMAAGIGLSMIAFIGTASIGLVILAVSRVQSFSGLQRDYLLQFSYAAASGNDAPYIPVLQKFCSKHHLLNIKYIDHDSHIELSFYVKFKDQKEKSGFIHALAQINGVHNINIFFDEE